MRFNQFILPAASEIAFSISYINQKTGSYVNQDESHIHKECEIYLNVSGDVSFEVEDHLYPVEPGCVILTRPYEFHHCVYHSSEPHKHYWITFASETDAYLSGLFFEREKGCENRIQLNAQQLEQAQHLLGQLLAREGDELQNRIVFLQFLQLLLQGKRLSGIGQLEGLPVDVRLALDHMDAYLAEDMDIHALADAAYVSVNTLERHFRQALGATPFAVLRKKRLFSAACLLRSGSPVFEAAVKSGFSDYSHFIMQFRKQYAMTPLRYQKLFQSSK